MSPVFDAISNIPQPVIPEQKDVDLSPLLQSINDAKQAISDELKRLESIEAYVESKKQEEEIERAEKEEIEREVQEEKNLKKPFPSQFTARIK